MEGLSEELLSLLAEEGTDVLAAFVGENSSDNSLVYQSLFYVLSKGVEFVLPTLLSASFGDPTAFTLGLIRRDISNIQKDLDYFREIPFHQIQYLIDEVKHDCEDEENHFDAYEKFKHLERKSIEAVFSSKKFENKVKAAEICVLAKSYIKRFNQDSRTFDELHDLDDSRKKSLACQMLKLLNEFVAMPEYLDAKEKAKEAWYRLEHSRRENHSIVDQVDELKISIYTNSVLCLPSIQESRTYLLDEEPVLVKTWSLNLSWIPEGERHAIETSLARDDVVGLFNLDDVEDIDEFGEWVIDVNDLDPNDEDQDDYENVTSESSSDNDEDDENILQLPKYFMQKSSDENLSDNEDEIEDVDLLTERTDERQISVHEENNVQSFGSRRDSFRIYTDLNGVVYIKAGLKCKLFLNNEPVEESCVVQSAWRIDEPPEHLRLEFLIMKEDLKLTRSMSVRKLNMTEDMGLELINLLTGPSESCKQRAEHCLHNGTITKLQWSVPYSQVVESLLSERDIQSPLFQPLPIDDDQPCFKVILDGRRRKIGIKKYYWTRHQSLLVAGMIVWNDDDIGTINAIAGLKTLSRNVKDLQLKSIDWDIDMTEAKYLKIDVFFFSE